MDQGRSDMCLGRSLIWDGEGISEQLAYQEENTLRVIRVYVHRKTMQIARLYGHFSNTIAQKYKPRLDHDKE